MADIRPICDTWILARPKVAYYGAYPAGFVRRARALLGVGWEEPVLHVCSGRVRQYAKHFAGSIGPNDQTLDVRTDLGEDAPDYVQDVTTTPIPDGFAAILTDPPYTPTDAQQYGPAPCPTSSALMLACLRAVGPGDRVGMLHYEWPRIPEWAREVAVITVLTGRGQRARVYTVAERVR